MKALIAMSGGVDSSVSALLTLKKGYECVGGTMQLFDSNSTGVKCCTSEGCRDAAAVAERLGMKHYVFDFMEDFKENVMKRFASEYERGGTPNPCVDCNRFLKFGKMLSHARELGCDFVVTGHYAVVYYNEETGRYELRRATDKSKDQTYFLHSLTQEQLAHTLFPLGELEKSEVREIAEANGFINAQKKDSQDICFIPDGDYAGFIERFTGKTFPEGDFCDLSGNVLAKHKGIIHYTIGQRKGLGVAFGKPVYVCRKDVVSNKVILGDNEDLFSSELDVCDFNWISIPGTEKPIKCHAKIRYNQTAQPATITQTSENSVHIVFDEPQRAIAKGQAAVLYDGDTVIGGGTIL